MARYTRCRHCLDPVPVAAWEPCDAPRPVCQRCRDLLAELGDAVVDPPQVAEYIGRSSPTCREPGSDDIRPKAKSARTGRWLFWACKKRNRVQDAHRIGREHGFPRDMLRWSPIMVDVAITELQSLDNS
jgi:hypothetical protein